MSNKELYVVDETGSIIDTIDSEDKYIKLSDGDKVVRKGVIQYLNDTTDIKYHFIKINPVAFPKYSNKYSILVTLISFIGYMDNILSYKNGKQIQMKDIPKICNVSVSTVKRQMNGIMKDDLIHKVKEKGKTYLVVNPYLCLRGRKVYLSLYEQFKLSSLREECEEWEK